MERGLDEVGLVSVDDTELTAGVDQRLSQVSLHHESFRPVEVSPEALSHELAVEAVDCQGKEGSGDVTLVVAGVL